jgi:hypothetical protein
MNHRRTHTTMTDTEAELPALKMSFQHVLEQHQQQKQQQPTKETPTPTRLPAFAARAVHHGRSLTQSILRTASSHQPPVPARQQQQHQSSRSVSLSPQLSSSSTSATETPTSVKRPNVWNKKTAFQKRAIRDYIFNWRALTTIVVVMVALTLLLFCPDTCSKDLFQEELSLDQSKTSNSKNPLLVSTPLRRSLFQSVCCFKQHAHLIARLSTLIAHQQNATEFRTQCWLIPQSAFPSLEEKRYLCDRRFQQESLPSWTLALTWGFGHLFSSSSFIPSSASSSSSSSSSTPTTAPSSSSSSSSPTPSNRKDTKQPLSAVPNGPADQIHHKPNGGLSTNNLKHPNQVTVQQLLDMDGITFANLKRIQACRERLPECTLMIEREYHDAIAPSGTTLRTKDGSNPPRANVAARSTSSIASVPPSTSASPIPSNPPSVVITEKRNIIHKKEKEEKEEKDKDELTFKEMMDKMPRPSVLSRYRLYSKEELWRTDLKTSASSIGKKIETFIRRNKTHVSNCASSVEVGESTYHVVACLGQEEDSHCEHFIHPILSNELPPHLQMERTRVSETYSHCPRKAPFTKQLIRPAAVHFTALGLVRIVTDDDNDKPRDNENEQDSSKEREAAKADDGSFVHAPAARAKQEVEEEQQQEGNTAVEHGDEINFVASYSADSDIAEGYVNLCLQYYETVFVRDAC